MMNKSKRHERDHSLIELARRAADIGIGANEIIAESGLCRATVIAVLNGWGNASSRRLIRLTIGMLADARAKRARELFEMLHAELPMHALAQNKEVHNE